MTPVAHSFEQGRPLVPFLKQGEAEADAAVIDAPDAPCLTEPARRLRISELQHWIDLSA
jgi:hypothetical protein